MANSIKAFIFLPNVEFNTKFEFPKFFVPDVYLIACNLLFNVFAQDNSKFRTSECAANSNKVETFKQKV